MFHLRWTVSRVSASLACGLIAFAIGLVGAFLSGSISSSFKTSGPNSISERMPAAPLREFRSRKASRESAGVIERPIQCHDQILKPVMKIMFKDSEVREEVNRRIEVDECTDLFEHTLADLNSDGVNEILVRGVPCGATGNCAFWIFQRRGQKYRVLERGGDYTDRAKMGDQILRTKTRGYYDILLRGHFSAAETGFYYLKFNGRKYELDRCLYEVPDYRSKKPKWHFITCDEFEASLNLEN